jgi:hypothetical protein
MKLLLNNIFLLFLFFIFGCTGSEVTHSEQDNGVLDSQSSIDKSVITPILHFNVIMAPDLSNRLTKYKKPVTDNDIIDSVLELIYPRIVNYRRKMNQMDKYRLDVINQQHIVGYNINPNRFFIDLSRFKNQGDRIQYLAPFNTKSQFRQDKLNFKNEFNKLTRLINANTAGSDIWTYLNEGLDNFKIDTNTTVSTFGKDAYRNEYKNLLLLFTDGYIESSNNFRVGKKSKILSQSMVDRFRDEYIRNGRGKDLKTYFEESGYGIIPLNNPILKYVDVLVLEMYDRSLGMGGATKSPTDMEIMKVFWEDWLKKSGVPKVGLLPITPTAAATKERILYFMGVN